jgi:hypothetical protein
MKPLWYITSAEGEQWLEFVDLDHSTRYKFAILYILSDEPHNLRILERILNTQLRQRGFQTNSRDYSKALRWAIAHRYIIPLDSHSTGVFTKDEVSHLEFGSEYEKDLELLNDRFEFVDSAEYHYPDLRGDYGDVIDWKQL